MIGRCAFCGCVELEKLRKVSIPAGQEYIEPNAFANCESLTEVSIADGIKRIDCYAFDKCQSLTHIFIPRSVVEIGKCAFPGEAVVTFMD